MHDALILRGRFDRKARYSLRLHIGLRPRVGWTVEFPDWVCWQGAKKGR